MVRIIERTASTSKRYTNKSSSNSVHNAINTKHILRQALVNMT